MGEKVLVDKEIIDSALKLCNESLEFVERCQKTISELGKDIDEAIQIIKTL